MNKKVFPDRTELNRKVESIIVDNITVTAPNDLLENTLRLTPIYANTFRVNELYTFSSHGGIALSAAATVSVRLRFGGVLVIGPLVVNVQSEYFISGHLGRDNAGNLVCGGFLITNAQQFAIRNIIAANFTVDNNFDFTVQKSTAGDAVVSEAFLFDRHPRI